MAEAGAAGGGADRGMRRLGAWWLGLGVLALAAALRLTGIRHGEPQWIFHPDVAKQANVARDLHEGRTFPFANRYGQDYRLALYPYGHSVLLAQGLNALGVDRKDTAEWTKWRWALALRWSSVAWALAALAALWRWGWPGAGRGPRLLAAALVAVEPFHAYFSHYGMNDVPLASLLVLAWLLAARMGDDRTGVPWRSALCGLLLGLGFGVKYQAVLGLALPGTAWLLAGRGKDWRWRTATAAALAGGAVMGAWWTCPALRLPAFFGEYFPQFMAWQANIMGEPLPLGEKVVRNLGLLARFGWRQGYGLLLVPWAVVLTQGIRGRLPQAVVRLAWPAAVFGGGLLAVFIVTRDFIRPADLVVMTPFWIWPVGWMGVDVVRSRGARRALLAALAVLWAGWTSAAALDGRALRRPDTQVRARDWCAEYFRPGDEVLYERYTLKTKQTDVDERMVIHLGKVMELAGVEELASRFLVVSSLQCDRFFDRLSPFYDEDVQAVYRGLDNTHVVVREFSDREMVYGQPHIRVYAPRAEAGR